VFVLAIMLLFTGGGLTLFAYRARDLKQGGIFAPISREGGLVLNNVLLTTACATVLVGTLYPLALESITGEKISVGAPFFNMTFGPLMIPLLLALPFGPFLAWKRGDLYAAAQRLAFAAVAALIAVAIGFAVAHRGPWLAPFGVALGVWVMAGAISEITFRAKFGQVPLAEAFRRARNLPRSAYGTMLAHFGMGLTVVGIIATSAYQSERILVMKPGEKVEIAGYELSFRGATPGKGPNYTELSGVFDVTRGGQTVTRLVPEKRIYDAPPQPTTEAGIHNSWRGDLYVVLGDQQANGGFAIRLYFHPFVRFIWIGTLFMFVGGGVSISDRRLRVGAPMRARKAPANAVPAE
jgi:cytochrome c-type biogenesis protein CcmF